MGNVSEIRKCIKDIANIQKNVYVGIVDKVDKQNKTINIKLPDIVLSNIPLTLRYKDINNNVILIIPKVDSYVLFCTSDNLTTCYCLSFSEIDEIIINGGELGGLIKINELKNQLDILSKRVDNISKCFTDSSVVCTPQDGGAGMLALQKIIINSYTKKENFDDIEDEKIKH